MRFAMRKAYDVPCFDWSSKAFIPLDTLMCYGKLYSVARKNKTPIINEKIHQSEPIMQLGKINNGPK